MALLLLMFYFISVLNISVGQTFVLLWLAKGTSLNTKKNMNSTGNFNRMDLLLSLLEYVMDLVFLTWLSVPPAYVTALIIFKK